MNRQFSVVYRESAEDGYVPGDAAAHRVAAGLAERADAPTLNALSEMLTLLEQVGGQFHVTTLRVATGDAREYETAALAFNFETRDAKIMEARPPEDVLGVPVRDSQEPPVEIEATRPEEPEPEEEPEPDREPEPALSD